uniref:Uncharacterized protein n=1 Tax=Ascaris lumbricoides TaxID=6252 RepID=A0A0M3HFN9_ASCLU
MLELFNGFMKRKNRTRCARKSTFTVHLLENDDRKLKQNFIYADLLNCMNDHINRHIARRFAGDLNLKDFRRNVQHSYMNLQSF